MGECVREMTFEEEYSLLQKEVKELFDKEDYCEPPKSHCIVRRALRCIRRLLIETEPYRHYEDLEKQDLLLRLPVKVGGTVYTNCSFGSYIRKKKRPYPCEVMFICWNGNERTSFMNIRNEAGSVWSVNFCNIGNLVYLTKEEAEAELKERGGNK